MEELVDHVDIDDAIIGETTKEEAHRNGHLHRAAIIFAFRDDRKLLLQLRTKEKNGLIDNTVGGHVKKGESYDNAAKREMKEELGLECPLKKLGTFYETAERSGNFRHYYCLYEAHISIEQEKQIVADSREVQALIPMELQEVIAKANREPEKFTVGFLTALNFYVKYNKLNFPEIPIR